MKLSRILNGLQDGTLFGRFGAYLSGTAYDRSQGKPLVQIRHKVLCGDDSIEIDNWLATKFDPVEQTPSFRRMTPVFVEIQGQRSARERVVTKGVVHLVENDCRLVATRETPETNPVQG